jgi:hypothetical protein
MVGTMNGKQTCKHCRGTTFCGASRDSAGNIKFKTACTTCVIRSALNPKVVYAQVVCSVCGGTGVIDPGEQARQAQRHSAPFLVAAVSFFVVSLVVLGASLVVYQRQGYRDEAQRLLQDDPNATMTKSELKAAVSIGMSQAQLKSALGEPESTKEMGAGVSTIELWTYVCTDGRVQISLRDGSVQGIAP